MSSPLENKGEQFNLDDYLRAQDKTRQVVASFAKKITLGMTEKEGRTLLESMMDDSGLEKRWHPTKFRAGPNTTKSFRDNSDEYTIVEDDVFFADIGPVYYNHEGDFGETFTIGHDPRHKHLAQSAKAIFYTTQKVWKEQKLTGKELYAFAQNEAKKLNLRLNSNMYGHRLGDFPHAVHSKEKLGNIDFSPTPTLWVLEIHVIDDEIGRGAFFEDILL